jgi:hypothetical protein
MRHQQRHRRKAYTTLVGTGLVASFALIVTACSASPSSSDTVASLPGHGSTSSGAKSGHASESQVDQAEINFAHCLRSHGVDEPDPKHVPGQSGLVVQVPSSTSANSAALTACNHLLPPASNAKQQQRAADLPGLTNYAQCMRHHDIALLDPDPRTGAVDLGNVPGITNGFTRHTPQFRSADEACRHLLPADVHDDGTGP